MKNLFYLILFFLIPTSLFAQTPNIEWQKCLGGTGNDVGHCIIQTFDGGFAIAGTTNSTDGDVSGNHGGSDIWVVKLDVSGRIEWQKCFGGDTDDFANSIIQTPDGGFVVAGETLSNNGNVSNNHGKIDAWIIKLSGTGEIQWQHCYGGTDDDFAECLIQTVDAGYLFVGATYSKNEGFFSHGNADVWVVKLDSAGNFKWQKLLGGSHWDQGLSVIQTTSGDYVIAAQTASIDGQVTGATGEGDTWIVKIDSAGTIKWERCFIGDNLSNPYSIKNTRDGGFVIAGQVMCTTNCGKIQNDFFVRGGYDAYVIKYNSQDSVEWVKTYGDKYGDGAWSISQTKDGGYIFTGQTDSDSGEVSGNPGGKGDYVDWTVKLDSSGNIKWQKCLGGIHLATSSETGTSIIQSRDGGFIFTGWAESNNGDVSGNHGGSDLWVVKLSPEKNSVSYPLLSGENISLSPNPSSGVENISYILAKPSDLKIELYNSLGEKLRTLLDAKEEAGSHEHEFDLSSLPSGSYCLRIGMNGNIESKVIELIK